MTRVELLYGDGVLPVDLPTENVTVVKAPHAHPLADEGAACRAAFAQPIASPPLADLLHKARRVAIVIPDGTRPLPFERLLTWLLAETDRFGCEAVLVRIDES